MAKTNFVGTNVPPDETVSGIVTQANDIYGKLRPWGYMLSSDQRPIFLKPRLGGERAMDLICSAAQERGVSLPGLSLESMKADLKVGAAAQKVQDALSNAYQLAADTRLAAYGEAWEAFLGYYAVLSSMASRDPELAQKLQPVVDFMAIGRRKAAPASQPSNSTSDSQE
jgi:hypothetical protein